MKKDFFITIILLTLVSKSFAQSNASEKEKPCYTKQWVDSVNTLSLTKLNAVVPNLIEWYSYEGQTQPVPRPSNIVNVVYVKVEEKCPVEKKFAKE